MVYQNRRYTQPRAKGTIAVEVFKERLRLRWGYAGKRYCLYIGLPDTKVNRVAAEAKAKQIELDIASSNFAATLKKHKNELQVQPSRPAKVDLFEHYTSEKAKSVYLRTLEKYKATTAYLLENSLRKFRRIPAVACGRVG